MLVCPVQILDQWVFHPPTGKNEYSTAHMPICDSFLLWQPQSQHEKFRKVLVYSWRFSPLHQSPNIFKDLKLTNQKPINIIVKKQCKFLLWSGHKMSLLETPL